MVKTLSIARWDGKVTTLEDVVLPSVFKKVLALAGCRRNILLVGPAGCGKSHIAELVAKSLALRFGAVNCTSGMSEAHLLGRGIPDLTHGKSRFQGTDFLTCYEEGGVFCLDELDAADPNLLLAINTALANDYCNVPSRPEKSVAKRHKDFIPIATANTWGRGATRQYAGRNQLDEATMDRFRIGVVECDYDMAVERALCPDDALRHLLQNVRQRIAVTGLRRIMSTRFMRDAYIMKEGAGWMHSEVLDTFFSGWTPEEVAKVRP
jgi:cobaltochelatase CobS